MGEGESLHCIYKLMIFKHGELVYVGWRKNSYKQKSAKRINNRITSFIDINNDLKY